MLSTERIRTIADLVSQTERELLLTAGSYPRHLLENLQLLDDAFETAINQWEWQEDIHSNEGIGVATAFMGRHLVGAEEIGDNARELLREFRTPEQMDRFQPLPAGQGFNELFQLTKGLKIEQYELVELMAARELIVASKKRLKQSPTEIDILLIAISIPTTPEFAEHVRSFLGLSETCLIEVYHRACDSSGSALYDLLKGKFDAKLNQAVPGFETGTSAQVTILADETAANKFGMGADNISPQLFSAAMSAMSINYHPRAKSTFRFIAGETSDVAEGAECLRYLAPYDQWPGYRQRPNVHFAPHLSTPESPDDVIFMDPLETGRYFKDNDLPLIAQAMDNLIDNLGLPAEKVAAFREEMGSTRKSPDFINSVTAKIKRLVIHHPSPAVFENLKRKLKNFYGFTDEQIQWVINEGNAPAATILIAMGRQLQDFSAGDLIMVNSFGAGGSFHCGFYEYLPKTTELVPSHIQTQVPDEKQTTDPLSLQ